MNDAEPEFKRLAIFPPVLSWPLQACWKVAKSGRAAMTGRSVSPDDPLLASHLKLSTCSIEVLTSVSLQFSEPCYSFLGRENAKEKAAKVEALLITLKGNAPV